jgi:tRNA A37 threonylcarbamoyladenosine modification protein TsaB
MSLRIPSASINYFDVIDYIAEEKKNNRLIIIKSKKNQAYFKKIQNGYEENGVSSYEQLIKKTEECDFLIGENIPEIYQLINSSRIIYKEIADFRNAKYLLNFSEQINKNSKIIPLYINAAMQASI